MTSRSFKSGNERLAYSKYWHKDGEKMLVETITLDKFIENYKINIKEISLIKIDIEGGEKIVIPNIVQILSTNNNISLLLSLHWHCLKINDIKNILTELFKIYNYVKINRYFR